MFFMSSLFCLVLSSKFVGSGFLNKFFMVILLFVLFVEGL